MPSQATGFAYKDEHGKIDVSTVQGDEIGVMVNYLVVQERVIIRQGEPDWFIKSMFEGKAKGSIVKIVITEV